MILKQNKGLEDTCCYNQLLVNMGCVSAIDTLVLTADSELRKT